MEKYKVYFLSDNVRERVEKINKKYNFIKCFEDGVFFHEVGIRKPNPKVYKIVLRKAGAKPEEAVSIDDKPQFLVPAERLGMNVVLFKSPRILRKKLHELKIL